MGGGGGGGVAQPQISLKTGGQSCVHVGRLRVLTSCGVFELSRLDDELLQDLLKRLRAPPPTSTLRPPEVTHVMNDTRPSRPSPLFRIHVLLSTQTEEQKERGRPGNEAN